VAEALLLNLSVVSQVLARVAEGRQLVVVEQDNTTPSVSASWRRNYGGDCCEDEVVCFLPNIKSLINFIGVAHLYFKVLLSESV